MSAISFIVIGRNEGWKLDKCLQSIVDTIEFNQYKNYEIIYVDSNSTDDSIERAKKYDKIKIFKLTCDANPAIARNVGAKEAFSIYFSFFCTIYICKIIKNIYNESGKKKVQRRK